MRLTFNMTFSAFAVVQFLLVTCVVILGLSSYIFTHLTGHDSLLGFLTLLDVGDEQSIPTYVSLLNLLLSSIMLFIVYRYEQKSSGRGSSYWLFLSVLFFFLSLDESASIHEKFSVVYKYFCDVFSIDPVLTTHQWLPFGVGFVLIVGAMLFPFLKTLPKDTRYYFLISAMIFLVGAIGFEFAGLLMIEMNIVESPEELSYKIRRIFEEGFEMYGIAFFNCVLYREIAKRKISLVIETIKGKDA